MVNQVAKGHFSITLKPEQPGLHELVIFIGEVDAPVYVHSPIEVPVMSIAQWREPRLKTFACGLNNPHSVAVSDNGKYVIVTESQRNCVTVFSAATGRLVRRFGQHGDGPGEFKSPRDIVVSADGFIFVIDSIRIQKFSMKGIIRARSQSYWLWDSPTFGCLWDSCCPTLCYYNLSWQSEACENQILERF